MDSRRLRGVCAAGTLVAAVATRALATTVTDARLELYGGRRAAGHQALTLHLALKPPLTDHAPLAVNVTVGATAVHVDASVGRSGRLTAHATHLDLRAAIPDFGVAHVELPAPLDAVVEFDANDCRARFYGRTLDCPASGANRPTDGAYDVAEVVDGSEQPASDVLALVSHDGEGDQYISLLLGIFDGISLHGVPHGATVALDGYSITGGDIYASVGGDATFVRTTSGWRIEGDVTSAPPVVFAPLALQFVLRRPDTGTPTGFGGPWTVTFQDHWHLIDPFTGDAILDLAVSPDGNATTEDTTLVDAGVPVRTLNAGDCEVAPAGAIACWLSADGVRMQGRLDVATGTGGGDFYVGTPPSIYAQGEWTAARNP